MLPIADISVELTCPLVGLLGAGQPVYVCVCVCARAFVCSLLYTWLLTLGDKLISFV